MQEQKNEENHATTNDLEPNGTEEIKGGRLKRIRIGGMSATEQANALPDLEPESEVVGGALKGKPMHLISPSL